jgi:hypothetical protein
MIKEFIQAWREVRSRNRAKRNDGITLGWDEAKPRVSSTNSINTNGARTHLSVINAINGRVIEIGNYAPNPHGPDWNYEHYIIADGEPLEPAMATILLMKGMK